MVPMIKKTLNQVTPHQHPLVREEVTNANSTDHDEFICSGCDTHGAATDVRYRCKQQYCNFNLHEDCATCPKTLSTHIHPKHQLKLVWRFKDDLPCCDVCGDQVKGLYYSCPDASCNTFVLHPICSKFPSHVSHVIDRKHNLTFQSAVPSWCTICRDSCTSWRYRCGPCKIDIHLECVTSTPCHDPQNSAAPAPKQKQQQYQPPAPNYPPPNKDSNYSYNYHQHQQYYYQQPPPPMQQQQHQHHHQEKSPLPNHDFGNPLQQPPLPHDYYAYDPSLTFGMASPPPVHHQYYYGQQQQQYYQQPPPFVAHSYNMYYHPQPVAYHQGGGGGCEGGGPGGGATNSSSSSTSSSGGKKRKMCLVVARMAASLTVSAVLGIPVISPFC